MSGIRAITGLGAILTGRLDQPVAEGDTVLLADGRIERIGHAGDLQPDPAASIDANGATLLPGLFDNHVHPVIGDYTPRQHQQDYLAGYVHGGVTSMVSAGEVHTPGRPKDRVGTKALAILAARAFANIRPGGGRVYAGAVLLEQGLDRDDFTEMGASGVRFVGEIGISSVQDEATAAAMTRMAQESGMTVVVHTGGASVPTSRTVDADFVLAVRPDVAAHVNGGPTAAPVKDVERILAETDAAIEIVHNGNVRALRDVVALTRERDELDRLLVGTDSPAGSGVPPLGVLRTLSWVCALGGVEGTLAVALASGNTARRRGLPGGVVEPGAPADLVLADAPEGSEAATFCEALELGDTPAVSCVLTDGVVVVQRSRNTPPAKRPPSYPAGP